MISRSLPRCFSILALTTALAPSGCVAVAGDAVETDESVSTDSEPIINGTVTSAEGSGFVQLITNGAGCSGTLVTNTWVLTAKHCGTAAGSTVQMGSQGRFVDYVVNHPSLDVTIAHVSAPLTMAGSNTGYGASLRATQLPAGTQVNCSGYGFNTFTTGFGTLRTAALSIGQAGGGKYTFFPNASGQIQWQGDSGGSCKDSGGNIIFVQSACTYVPSTGTVLSCDGPSSDVLAGWVNAGSLSSNPIDRSEIFVRQAYLDVLEREPDSGGFAWWLSVMQGCNGAPACLAGVRVDMSRGMLESAEIRAKYPELSSPASAGYKGAFLTHCYTSFLRRQPDTAGYNYWLSYLTSSSDYNGIISSMLTSAEYRGRFGAP